MSEKNQVEVIKKLIDDFQRNYSWYNADETEHIINNLRTDVKNLEKKVDILIKLSKVFSKHIKEEKQNG